MPKLIKILAASVGSGLLLGAGIRLGETLVRREPRLRPEPEADERIASRLGGIEERLLHLEAERRNAPTEEVPLSRRQVEKEAEEVQAKLGALSESSVRLRGELQTWLEDNVGRRMADVEQKLRAESEHSRKEMLDAFVEGIQTRVMHRIAKLESELAGQSAAMTELRECSIRTEQSMQKLLGGLDKLILAQQPRAVPEPEPPASDSGDQTREEERGPAAESQSTMQTRGASKRWAIFS